MGTSLPALLGGGRALAAQDFNSRPGPGGEGTTTHWTRLRRHAWRIGPLELLAFLTATVPPASGQPSVTGPSGPGDPPAGADRDATEDGAGSRMSFLKHLDELRKRLFTSLIAIFLGFLICFAFVGPILDFIMQPLTAVLPEAKNFIYTEPTEGFYLRLKMAALAGLLLATPVVVSQLWLFVAPGLYANEKKFAIPFVLLASAFFIAGALFGHYVLFRLAWAFLGSFETEWLDFTPRIQSTFALYVKLVLACAVVFQLPTVVFFFARMGVVSHRFLIRNFKYAFLLCFVLAAVLTPTPDAIIMTVMAGPMLALYVLSIGIAWGFRRRGMEDA